MPLPDARLRESGCLLPAERAQTELLWPLFITLVHERRRVRMSEACCGLKLGQKVPDFELTTYEPTKGDFGKVGLAEQIKNKRWTILFFYPADFTVV